MGQKVFAKVIKLGMLRWGDFTGLSEYFLNAVTYTFITVMQKEV